MTKTENEAKSTLTNKQKADLREAIALEIMNVIEKVSYGTGDLENPISDEQYNEAMEYAQKVGFKMLGTAYDRAEKAIADKVEKYGRWGGKK